MNKKYVFILVFVLHLCVVYCQQHQKRFVLGFAYGMGEELKNNDYTYTNSFYKLHLEYTFKTAKHFSYELIVQPEINFGKHQLLNKYFVQPDEPDYEALRKEYAKLKKVHDYILNLGIIVRKPISNTISIYILGSIGPMITDTKTERLSKGFAFSDVIALGVSLKSNKIFFDFRPSLRHVSNAGFQESNAGFNTVNVELQLSFGL